MIKTVTKFLALATLFLPLFGTGCGSGVMEVPVPQAEVDVYRALARKNATFAKVAPGEFRIDPDGLSTFELDKFNVANKQCKLRFIVEGVNSKPAPGTQGAIKDLPGYMGTYSPILGGEGHWSIKNANRTKEEMQQDFTNYAIDTKRISVNDTYTGSSKSLCQTPDSSN